MALGLAPHGADIGDAQVQRRAAIVVGAELAEQDRPVVGGRPCRDLVEVRAERRAVLVAAPGDPVQLLDLFAGPGRALVGEMERLVIMEGDEQVRVVGQLQRRQVVEAVPVRRADDDDPGRIGLADQRQLLGEQPVPGLAVRACRAARSGARTRRCAAHWRSAGRPAARTPSASVRQTFRSSEQGLKSCSSMMTPSPAFCASRTTSSSLASHAGSSRFCASICLNAWRTTRTKSKPALADLGEMAPLEAALGGVGPIGVVAEHVDAAMKRLVRLGEHGRRRVARGVGRRRRHSRQASTKAARTGSQTHFQPPFPTVVVAP